MVNHPPWLTSSSCVLLVLINFVLVVIFLKRPILERVERERSKTALKKVPTDPRKDFY